jgi:aminoglycoside phosphotransferase (APT) family kinase protein
MVSLAGGEADLAWWILFDHVSSAGRGLPRLPGLGTAEETVALWEKVSGQRASDLEWYLVYAAFRMCLAVTRAAQLLARSGLLRPGSEMETNNVGTQYLVSMLDLPPQGPVAVRWPGLGR